MGFRAVALAAVFALGALPAFAQPADDAAIRRLLDRLERVIEQADREAYTSLLIPAVAATPAAAARASNFTTLELRPGVTKATVFERDRQELLGTLAGNGYRLMIDSFIESNARARIAT